MEQLRVIGYSSEDMKIKDVQIPLYLKTHLASFKMGDKEGDIAWDGKHIHLTLDGLDRQVGINDLIRYVFDSKTKISPPDWLKEAMAEKI